jgi:hypothetical protein
MAKEPQERYATAQQMAEARFRLKVRLVNSMGLCEAAKLMSLNNQQFITREKAIRILEDEGNTWQFPIFTPEMLQGSFDFQAAGMTDEPAVTKQARRDNLVVMGDKYGNDPLVNKPKLLKEVFKAHDFKDPDSYLNGAMVAQYYAQINASAQPQQAVDPAAAAAVQPPVDQAAAAPGGLPPEALAALAGGDQGMAPSADQSMTVPPEAVA